MDNELGGGLESRDFGMCIGAGDAAICRSDDKIAVMSQSRTKYNSQRGRALVDVGLGGGVKVYGSGEDDGA